MSTLVRPSAIELIRIVMDEGSFEPWDEPIDTSGHPEGYRAELAAAEEKSGVDESVVTGRGAIRGRAVAVVVNEFRFLGGSIGAASADRIIAAVRRATREGLPLVAATASGGTRMQEGTPAFVRMADISRAIVDHKSAGLPYIVHLRHPTTGGVYASWGSLGHVTVAEPGALIGFLGPKVFRALEGREFPEGVQVAENLVNKGVIDGVIATENLAEMLDRALHVLVDPGVPAQIARPASVAIPRVSLMESLERTRRVGRAGTRDILNVVGSEAVRLRGTDEGERDSAIIVALARLDGLPCVVVGQDRRRQTAQEPMGPAALREARRGMHLAQELRLPLVTVVDTPGAELSVRAEERAMAGEIARCIQALLSLTVPSVSVLLGQGCGGGALALLPAKRVIAAECSWLAPLPLEGASVIVYGDSLHAEEMAHSLRISAFDLLRNGTIRSVIPEESDPHADPVNLATAVVAEASWQIRDLVRSGR